MTTTRERYKVTIHPGRNPAMACAKLARVIIDRWLPNHAGGAPVLLARQLCPLLMPSFQKACRAGRDIVLDVDTTNHQPVITELP